MSFEFGIFNDAGLKESFVQWLVEERWPKHSGRFGRLWEYYQNPMIRSGSVKNADGRIADTSRGYTQAQEAGLPVRITGRAVDALGTPSRPVGQIQRKEIVIENDIAWRINAMVDFLFGKGITILSRGPAAARRSEIEEVVKTVFEANGGAGFFQEMAVLGAVYGFADCLIRPGERLYSLLNRESLSGASLPSHGTRASLLQLASSIALELIEAPRALPILEEADYRKIRYYVQHFIQPRNETTAEGGFLKALLKGRAGTTAQNEAQVTEVIGPHAWQRYEDFKLAAEGVNPLGFVPVVHIQNIAQPYFYEGFSDAEQLVPMQDELNTRLSDRASRITMQSFKMYLAKGLEGFEDKPVSPGRMWFTWDKEAKIDEFGGDGSCPSEDLHIAEVREAMDKISGVTPVVAGVLKNKLGNLTSGVALKMTFMGMLTRNARKQFTYGQGLRRIAETALEILDKAGVYKTSPEERQIEVHFPNPLPEDMLERLKEAQIKKDLGVSQEKVLEELGYGIQ